ncbi:MAG: sigma-70 family RNA polymerase sigma factor [Acidobacteria bacterium]|nr:MAG: sigma-70 family RNA polymerase sigma factor [Acidobacteriota bacterium]
MLQAGARSAVSTPGRSGRPVSRRRNLATKRSAGDPDLVRSSRRGDLEAFSELVRRYQRPLTAVALRSTGDLADADDLVQETFLRAFDRLDRLEDPDRFGPWLFRILRNLLADRGRRAGREVSGEEAAAEMPDTAPGAEAELLAREAARAVREAIDAIPPGRQREVFEMRYLEGLPVQEIARRLGVHTGTIKVHLHRTVRRLRKVVGARLAGATGAWAAGPGEAP